jgi:hypothetical protein
MIRIVIILTDSVLSFYTSLTQDVIERNVSSALRSVPSQAMAIDRLYRYIPHCAPSDVIEGVYHIDMSDILVDYSYQPVG